MKIVCKRCHKVLKNFGGLIFSPPETHERVYKFHICLQCYFKLMDWLIPSVIYEREKENNNG